MKMLMMATKGCVQFVLNDTYFSDSWFSGVKTAEEVMTEGVDYCGLAKTSHKGLCLSTLEKLIKEWPLGSYLVMKSNPRVTSDITLMAIGHKQNSRKVLGFIATEGAVITKPGNAYLYPFPDIYSNVSVCLVFSLTC